MFHVKQRRGPARPMFHVKHRRAAPRDAPRPVRAPDRRPATRPAPGGRPRRPPAPPTAGRCPPAPASAVRPQPLPQREGGRPISRSSGTSSRWSPERQPGRRSGPPPPPSRSLLQPGRPAPRRTAPAGRPPAPGRATTRSASRSSPAARTGSPAASASRPCAASRVNRWTSTSSGSTASRYPAGWFSMTLAQHRPQPGHLGLHGVRHPGRRVRRRTARRPCRSTGTIRPASSSSRASTARRPGPPSAARRPSGSSARVSPRIPNRTLADSTAARPNATAPVGDDATRRAEASGRRARRWRQRAAAPATNGARAGNAPEDRPELSRAVRRRANS